MVKMTGSYQGGLRCETEHGPSHARLATDAPTDNQGKGEAFSPTDLLATSVATCMMTSMGIAAARDGVDLSGSRYQVIKEMVADPKRRVARLALSFEMAPGVAPEARARLIEAAETCPARISLRPDIAIDLAWTWR